MIKRDYKRTIPRDLFNESKLLKCLGQLSLLIHNEVGIRWPLRLVHDPEGHGEGFVIGQEQSDGALICLNVKLYCADREIKLFSPYNSKEPYPLMADCSEEDIRFKFTECEYEVFTNEGKLSQDFQDFLDGLMSCGVLDTSK